MKVISPFKGKAAAFTYNHRISTIHYAARPFWAHLLPKLSAASAWNITVPIQTRTVDVHIAKAAEKLNLARMI